MSTNNKMAKYTLELEQVKTRPCDIENCTKRIRAMTNVKVITGLSPIGSCDSNAKAGKRAMARIHSAEV